MLLVIALVLAAIFVLQAWNRHVKGKKKVAPAKIFKAHMTAGVLTLVFFLVHGLPKLLSGHAPMPNLLTGALLGVVLLATVVLGAATKKARGPKRKTLARCHGLGAAAALVLLVAHVGVAVL